MDMALERAPAASATPALVARGGGAGGVRAIPVGVVDISDQQTRFVPINDRKKLVAAILSGIGLGLWLARRRR